MPLPPLLSGIAFVVLLLFSIWFFASGTTFQGGKALHVRIPPARGRRHVDAVVQRLSFPYCHLVAPKNASLEWLLESRVETDEDRLAVVDDVVRDWRDHRCVVGDAFHDFDIEFDTYVRAARALNGSARIANFTRLAMPRVRDIIFDPETHEAYYAVLMHDGKGELNPVLVSHTDLCETLVEYRRQFTVNSRGTQARLPCVCPSDFGIVGSGLYFEPPDQDFLRTSAYHPRENAPIAALCGYRIYLDVDIARAPLEDATNVVYSAVDTNDKIHAFPGRVKQELFPPARRDFQYYRELQVNAVDPLPLLADTARVDALLDRASARAMGDELRTAHVRDRWPSLHSRNSDGSGFRTPGALAIVLRRADYESAERVIINKQRVGRGAGACFMQCRVQEEAVRGSFFAGGLLPDMDEEEIAALEEAATRLRASRPDAPADKAPKPTATAGNAVTAVPPDFPETPEGRRKRRDWVKEQLRIEREVRNRAGKEHDET
jgi:hypothetical protein